MPVVGTVCSVARLVAWLVPGDHQRVDTESPSADFVVGIAAGDTVPPGIDSAFFASRQRWWIRELPDEESYFATLCQYGHMVDKVTLAARRRPRCEVAVGDDSAVAGHRQGMFVDIVAGQHEETVDEVTLTARRHPRCEVAFGDDSVVDGHRQGMVVDIVAGQHGETVDEVTLAARWHPRCEVTVGHDSDVAGN